MLQNCLKINLFTLTLQVNYDFGISHKVTIFTVFTDQKMQNYSAFSFKTKPRFYPF